MTDEAAAPIDTGAPSADVAAPEAASTPAASDPPRSVAETLAASFDAIQKREGNAPGQRGADGKFAPQAPAAAAATDIPDQPATEGNEPPQAAIEAPQSWSAEMKAKFATLPPEAQQYVAQRESEAHAKISDQGNKLKAFDGLSHVLEPRRNELMQSYGSVEKGVSDLLSLHSRYHTDPWPVIQGLAQGAGIRITRLDQSGQPALEAPQADPRIAALSQELAGIKSTLTTQALGEAQKLVDAFKAKPEHKHYAAVESRIAQLLSSGAATDLPSAYEMATWADPEVRKALLAEQAAADKARADAEAKRLADQARNANGVNVRTTGARASSTSKPKSMRESLERAYDTVNGAA